MRNLRPLYQTVARSCGLHWRLSVNQTWVYLFVENERRSRVGNPRPRTDSQITDIMRREFPQKDSAIYRRVSQVRWRYNTGQLFGPGALPPVTRSFAYNRKGQRVFKPRTTY